MKGFTLIEIIIVLSIISITAGAGYLRYTQTSQGTSLKKTTADLGNMLNQAKERTIRRDMTPNPGCTEFRGYDVLINTAVTPQTYQVRFICRPAAADTFLAASPVYSLPARTVFVMTPPLNVPFYSPFGCVDATFPDSNCSNTAATRTIQIRNQIINNCITITVNNLGVITEGDPVPC